MKTLSLAIITMGGIASATVLGAFIILNPLVPIQLPLNATDYEMQRIYTFCTNPALSSQGSDVFVTCDHPANYTASGPITPPLPVYKREECHSIYGCSGKYVYELQTPKDFLSDEQKQEVIERALQATALSHYQGVQFERMDLGIHDDHWFAQIDFVIPHIEYVNGHCGWQAAVSVDLNDFHVDPALGMIGDNRC